MSTDITSRILVISSSLENAKYSVRRIKAVVDGPDPAELPQSNTIPWTISNKYYSADVHFQLADFNHFDPRSVQGVPAVIYVWQRGDPYSDHILSLARQLSEHEHEVTLAIALGSRPPHHDDPAEGPDQFLAEHGFEYIDAERTPHASNDDDGDHHAVQGLSRVIDALSTVMWPSMVRKETSAKRASQIPSLFDVMPEEEGLASLMAADAHEQGAPQTRASRLRREIAELERWLIENEDLHEHEEQQDEDDPDLQIDLPELEKDPWTRSPLTAFAETALVSPTYLSQTGFDDDFTEFISAPTPPSRSPLPESSTSSHLHDATPQVPISTGNSWSSFNSKFDHFKPDHPDDDEDENDAFGIDADECGYEALDDHFFSHHGSSGSRPAPSGLSDVDYHGAFDLRNILSTLQGMREGVSGIEDEDARKALSARLASNFVFQRMGGGTDDDIEDREPQAKDSKGIGLEQSAQ